MEELNMPPVCQYMAERPRGLVLVTGPTGCGKSTSLAAMIRHVNEHFPVHIMTIEDPIEFVHEDSIAVVNQRMIGLDTHGWLAALRTVLRQDPDVILVGEMRDLETIAAAITAAETGHLVFATLHTTDAVQTVDRIIDVFPTFQQAQVRMQLAVNLVGVISQSLLKRRDGNGRIAAWEILVATPPLRNLIREAKTHQIPGAMQTGAKQGMFTLEQSLAKMVREGVIDYEAALERTSRPIEFERLVRGDDDELQQGAVAAEVPEAYEDSAEKRLGEEADAVLEGVDPRQRRRPTRQVQARPGRPQQPAAPAQPGQPAPQGLPSEQASAAGPPTLGDEHGEQTDDEQQATAEGPPRL